MNKYPTSFQYLVRFLLLFAVVAFLILSKKLLIPLFISVLFAYLLYPAAHKLEKWNIPRLMTNLILIVGAVVIVSAIAFGIISLFIIFTNDLPEIKAQVDTNITQLRWALGRTFGVTAEQLDSIVASMKGSGQYIIKMFTGTFNTLFIVGLTPVYTFLLLFYRDKFRVFLKKLIPSERQEETQKIIDQAKNVVPKYIKGLLIVFSILVAINSLGFYIIGIKYALLIGFIAAFFNLIPYLGTIIGYAIATIFVLATQSPTLAMWVVAQFVIVQFIENNILTPNITGSYVQINSMVTILSLVAAGMIWGLPGMFLVIPYIAILKIICENVDSLKPIGYLLGTRGTEKYYPTIASLKEKLYWRDEE